MNERKMNIMVLDKDEYKEYLLSRGYETDALKWIDENWDELCDFAESDELSHLIFPNRIKSYLSQHISHILGKHELHCLTERIMWFSVKEIYQLKDAAPNCNDIFIVETNPIPKANVEEYLHVDEIWEYHLDVLYDQGNWGFSYLESSVRLIDEGEYFTVEFEIY